MSKQSAANTSEYRAEHLVADARTRETYQDLGSYFSEVDPGEPSTSAANIELPAAASDRDVEGTELSKTSRNPPRCFYSRDRYESNHVTFAARAMPSETGTCERNKYGVKPNYCDRQSVLYFYLGLIAQILC